MRYLALAFALAALATGLVAAWYWYQSSVVGVVPNVDKAPRGGMAEASGPWVAGSIDSIRAAGALNKRASLWTAFSVFLGTISNLIGIIGSN
jgi:hypothetical protein